MTGFDDQTLMYMLDRLKVDKPDADLTAAREIFNLALTYDVDFMVQAGIIKDDGFTDEYYDEDDAFDFIIEHISNARPEFDAAMLAELIDLYFEYHDAFMEQQGLLSWE